MTIRSPDETDGLVAFAITILLACAIGGVIASWWVSP